MVQIHAWEQITWVVGVFMKKKTKVVVSQTVSKKGLDAKDLPQGFVVGDYANVSLYKEIYVAPETYHRILPYRELLEDSAWIYISATFNVILDKIIKNESELIYFLNKYEKKYWINEGKLQWDTQHAKDTIENKGASSLMRDTFFSILGAIISTLAYILWPLITKWVS